MQASKVTEMPTGEQRFHLHPNAKVSQKCTAIRTYYELLLNSDTTSAACRQVSRDELATRAENTSAPQIMPKRSILNFVMLVRKGRCAQHSHDELKEVCVSLAKWLFRTQFVRSEGDLRDFSVFAKCGRVSPTDAPNTCCCL